MASSAQGSARSLVPPWPAWQRLRTQRPHAGPPTVDVPQSRRRVPSGVDLDPLSSEANVEDLLIQRTLNLAEALDVVLGELERVCVTPPFCVDHEYTRVEVGHLGIEAKLFVAGNPPR